MFAEVFLFSNFMASGCARKSISRCREEAGIMPDIHDFRFVTNQINKNDKSEEQSWKKENTHFTTDIKR